MNPNFANREVVDLDFITLETGVPYMFMDYALASTTGLSASRVYAKGGQGAPKRIAFDGEREGTLKIDTQIETMKLYSMILGGAIDTTYIKVVKETLTSTDPGKLITLTKTPVSGSITVYAATDDFGTPVTISANGAAVTVPDAATKYTAHYLMSTTDSKVHHIKVSDTTFPKAFVIYGLTTIKTEDDEELPMYLTYFKAQPQSTVEFTTSSTGDPPTLSITFDLLADENGDIYDMAVVDD